jgi:hypothetical protein
MPHATRRISVSLPQPCAEVQPPKLATGPFRPDRLTNAMIRIDDGAAVKEKFTILDRKSDPTL